MANLLEAVERSDRSEGLTPPEWVERVKRRIGACATGTPRAGLTQDTEAEPNWLWGSFIYGYSYLKPVYVSSCDGAVTCDYAIPKAGRMYVKARMMLGASYASEPACFASDVCASVGGGCGAAQEPKLVLRCDGRTDADTVLRGDRMECTASAEPAGATMAGITWEFHDEQGHTITGPAGEMKWGGVMVVGGQMKVSATVNGKPQAPTLAVTVRARDWTGKIEFPEEPDTVYVRGEPLIYPPLVEGDTLADGTLGLSTWAQPEPASGWGEGSGPNEGWFFLDQPAYFSKRESHIWLNVALLPNDPFYKAQQGPPRGQVVMGRPLCGQDFMRMAARHVPLHEHGHYSRAKEFAESAAGAALLESTIHFGDPVEPEQVAEAFAAYRRASDSIQQKWDQENVLSVPCDFTPIRAEP